MHVLVEQHCDHYMTCVICQLLCTCNSPIQIADQSEFLLNLMEQPSQKRDMGISIVRLTCHSKNITSFLLDSIINICCHFKFQGILRRNNTLGWLNRKQRIWTNLQIKQETRGIYMYLEAHMNGLLLKTVHLD